MKVCSECGIEKNESEYYKRHNQCKACVAVKAKIYRQKNKEKVVAKIKKYQQENKEKIAKYLQENKVELTEKRKIYRQVNKVEIAVKKKIYRQTPALYKSYSHQLFADQIAEGKNELLLVACKQCGKLFNPTNRQCQHRISAINGKGSIGTENHFYCSQECKDKCAVFANKKINPDDNPFYDQSELRIWSQAVKERNRRENNGVAQCEICGAKDRLESHHIEPKKTHPEKALDLNNGMVLCHTCHIKHGHDKDDFTCSLDGLKDSICNLTKEERT